MKIVKLQVDGMSCASCAKAVEKSLCAVPGVEKASVNFVSQTAAIDVQDATATEQKLIDAVKRAGYHAHLPARNREADESRAARLAIIKVIGTGALLGVGWLLGATKLVPPVVSTTFVIIALVLAAWPICRRAVKALLAKRLDADVLVSIAVIAASSVGEFVAAGEVAFIMLLGAQLEEYTIRRARRSLGSLLTLVPPTARVRRDGTEIEVAATDLRVGDLVVVRAGERIPVDGIVQSGMASVNQAPVTGESMPVDRSEGNEVYVGTLAETGALIIEAKRVGEDTTLARIAQLVEQAHQREAPIQRTLDRAAGWLVPVMLTLSALVYLFSHDLPRAITVLIVACPCALILATPTAIMAAISRAARAGVLIKGGQYLEATARLHTIVFDKTGTLTHGTPEVTHVSRFDEHSEAEIVELAAVAEKMSAHPVARAIMRKAAALGLSTVDPSQFQAHHGRGVVAESRGQKLVVGQTGLMDDQLVPMSDAFHAHMDEHHDEGHTTIVVAHDGKVCGTICVSDTVRAKADEAIRDLRDLGVEKVVMLTGDNQRVAMQIAGKLGLDDVKADVLPEQKAEHIASLKQPGRTGVAM